MTPTDLGAIPVTSLRVAVHYNRRGDTSPSEPWLYAKGTAQGSINFRVWLHQTKLETEPENINALK